MRSIKLTEVEYEQFAAWVKGRKFSYTSEMETKVESVMESAKNEKYFDQLQPLLYDLKNKITLFHSEDLTHHKSEISRILEQEIAFHYQLVQGQVEVSEDADLDIEEARKLLIDQERYEQLLSLQ